jgi:hypothetical protein
MPTTVVDGQRFAADTASNPTPAPMSRSEDTFSSSGALAMMCGIIMEPRP